MRQGMKKPALGKGQAQRKAANDHPTPLPHIGPVARELLGEPNGSLSKKTELRFGTHGSLAVDLESDQWYDHEAEAGGGVLGLIEAKAGIPDRAGQLAWLEERGFKGRREKPAKPVEMASYDYCDEQGNLLFQVVRMEPKSFRQRRPFQDGWVHGITEGEYQKGRGGNDWYRYKKEKDNGQETVRLQAVRTVVYRLPEIAANTDAEVFVVEGEKDADQLSSLGLLATCNAGGAGKWTDAHSNCLAGRRVVILPDNDEPGHNHARKAKESLEEAGIEVRVLCLPDLPPKGDVSDWLDAGGNKECLLELMKEPGHDLPQAESMEDADNAPSSLEVAQQAIAKLDDDPGALFEQEMLDLIAKIRQDSPADWQRIRAAAKQAKVQVSELDKLTRQAKEEQGGLFATIEPWPEAVDGAALVRELSDTLRQFVICEPAVADTAALWIVFTWFIDEVHIAPIANITAPLPNCGKSTMLGFLERFSFQPLKCDGISPAALFRSMDMWQPTLLIDEVDTFLRDNEDARGILNSGHIRNGFIIRVVGENHIPTRFATYGAKALCGIGAIANTLTSRSLRLELRRKLPHEKVENIRFMDTGLASRLQRQLCRLHDDEAANVARARPEPAPGLENRDQDNWEPLLQIADTIGGEWPERVRKIAQIITGMDDADQAPDVATELLKDIQTVFDEKRVDRIFSADLTEALWADGEAPWNTWSRGKPMSARQLSAKLSDFGIRSKQIRIGSGSKKGYELADFRDAFDRYLLAPPAASETTKQASNQAGSSDSAYETESDCVSDKKRHEPSSHGACFDVPDKTPPTQKNAETF